MQGLLDVAILQAWSPLTTIIECMTHAWSESIRQACSHSWHVSPALGTLVLGVHDKGKGPSNYTKTCVTDALAHLV